jgi:hypothetical protein
VALSVSDIAVESAVLVAAALSVDDRVTVVADAASRSLVGVGVKRAETRLNALSVVEGKSVVALALAVDVGLVVGADSLAEAVDLLVSRFAEALIGVGIVVVSGRTVGADSPNSHVLGLADALSGGLRVELVDALAGNVAADLLELIVGLAVKALGTGSLHDVVALGAVALAGVEVVDLVGAALDAADALVDVVELAGGALGAEVVDQVVSGFADAATVDPVLVGCADGSANSVAALSAHLVVTFNAITALVLLVVDLGGGIALSADSTDKVEAGEAATSADSGIPDLVGFASSAADTVGGVVGEEGRADSARVADQVVSLLALASAVDIVFVGVAGSGAETEVGDETLVADAAKSHRVVVGVQRACGAGSVSQLVVLRKTDTRAGANIEDPLRITRNSTNSESLVIDLIPLALSADAVDGVVSSNAAALSVLEDLIDAAADHTVVALVGVSRGAAAVAGSRGVSGVSGALGAGSVDAEVGSGALAHAGVLVVDLVGQAGDTADGKGGVVELASRALSASSVDEEISDLALANLVDEDLVGRAGGGRNGERCGGERRTSGGDAVFVVEDVSLDAVALLGELVVGGVGLAAAADTVDLVEAALALADEGVEVEDFVGAAGGSADGELGIVVVGSRAVGADALDQVETVNADAVAVDQFLVDGTDGVLGCGRGDGRDVDLSARAVDEDVAVDAGAGEGREVVSRVGGADIAQSADEVEAEGADAAAVLVDFVASANGDDVVVGDTVGALEVEADDANALAEDVVVDLVIGAGNGGGGRAGGGLNVGGGGVAGLHGGGGSVAESAVLGALAVDVLIGLALVGVDRGGVGLRVERHH